jgi:hypothetical protein
MAVPWLVVGQLVLSNLDKIIAVVKPGGFTRKKDGAPSTPPDLVSQQISELQTAASNNAEQIAALAAQVKELVASLAQTTKDVAAKRAAAKRMALVAFAISGVALVVAIVSLVVR